MEKGRSNAVHTKVRLTRKAVALVLSRHLFNFIVTVILLLIFGAGVIYFTSRPAFCGYCHVVRPDIEAWRESTHRNVNCIACHVEPGIIALLKEKVLAVKEPIVYFTGRYETPINKGSELAEHISNETCFRCHGVRGKENIGGLYMNHQAHEKYLKCAECHNRVAHNIKGYKDNISMQFCFRCHDGNALRNDCELCHTESFIEKGLEKLKKEKEKTTSPKSSK